MKTQNHFIDYQKPGSEMSCLGEFATFQDYAKKIQRIAPVADERRNPLRILDGAAIRTHFPKHEYLYEQLKPLPKHDMDFVTYSKFRLLTKRLFVDLGYEPYTSLMLSGAAGRHRQIFNDKTTRQSTFFSANLRCATSSTIIND